MKKKRYEVKGMMEWHPEFNVGRSCVRVSFTGGHLCSGCTTPASYETADPVVQRVIESSEAFLSGRIRLAAGSIGQECSGSAECASLTSMVFRDLTEASEILHYEKGVPLASLMDKESCVMEGRKLGIDVSFDS